MKKLLLLAIFVSGACVFAQNTQGNMRLSVYCAYYKGDTIIHSVDTFAVYNQERIERGDSKAWLIAVMGQPLTRWIYGDKKTEKWEYRNKLVFLKNDYIVFIHSKTNPNPIYENQQASK